MTRKVQEPFVTFSSWLIKEKGKSVGSTYTTCSQIRKIVRNCLNKDNKYHPSKEDFQKVTVIKLESFINGMKQKNRSPYRRSWRLLEEFLKEGIASSSFKEEHPEIREILKKYQMKQPINWLFTGQTVGGKHIIINSEYGLRRMIDEEDFLYLLNGRKQFKNEKIWLTRVK